LTNDFGKNKTVMMWVDMVAEENWGQIARLIISGLMQDNGSEKDV
jgi:hypothetical protein